MEVGQRGGERGGGRSVLGRGGVGVALFELGAGAGVRDGACGRVWATSGAGRVGESRGKGGGGVLFQSWGLVRRGDPRWTGRSA